MIRRIAESLSRGRRVRRTLPNGVPLYVSPDSQLKYLKGRFDADLVALAAERVDATSRVWDIGANCGVFAFSCAAAAQVVAVEADPFLASLLQQSAALNGAPVEVVTAAAWSSPGLASFSIAARGRASNFLTAARGHGESGGVRGTLTVPTLTLDALLAHFGPPTLVKIDVEGAEEDVLRGATRLLGEARPVIYIEIAPGREAIRDQLETAGYRLTRGAEMNWLAEPA